MIRAVSVGRADYTRPALAGFGRATGVLHPASRSNNNATPSGTQFVPTNQTAVANATRKEKVWRKVEEMADAFDFPVVDMSAVNFNNPVSALAAYLRRNWLQIYGGYILTSAPYVFMPNLRYPKYTVYVHVAGTILAIHLAATTRNPRDVVVEAVDETRTRGQQFLDEKQREWSEYMGNKINDAVGSIGASIGDAGSSVARGVGVASNNATDAVRDFFDSYISHLALLGIAVYLIQNRKKVGAYLK